MKQWLEELLDLDIGLMAIKYLGKLREGKHKSNSCCGVIAKKFAIKCPKCRKKYT